MQRHHTSGAGAYLTGPAVPNPTALFAYAVAPQMSYAKQLSFAPAQNTTPETSDEVVREAIERLTKAPGNDPAALQQAALDMELVIRHFDSLSETFGPEAALTSLALDLAEKAKKAPQSNGKTRVTRSVSRSKRSSRYSKH
jgi:hypothetical protein